jgi:hypothetical protein
MSGGIGLFSVNVQSTPLGFLLFVKLAVPVACTLNRDSTDSFLYKKTSCRLSSGPSCKHTSADMFGSDRDLSLWLTLDSFVVTGSIQL